jgi:protein phosphatase
MPIAAIINDSILCMHGGIGSTLTNIIEIQNIPKPIKVNHDPKTKNEKIVYDLLWSDPCKGREPAGSPNLEHDYLKTKAVNNIFYLECQVFRKKLL